MPLLSRWSRNVLLAAFLAGAFLVLAVGRAEGETALASWYGPGFEGLPTAGGEPYDPWGYTAAHKTLPLGTELQVSYGGNSVMVTVNDRGPYVGDRELDLSQGAAQALGLTGAGVDYVEYSYVGGAASQYGSTDAAVYDRYGYSEAAYAQPTGSVYQYGDAGVPSDQYGYAGQTVGYSGYDEYVYDGADVSGGGDDSGAYVTDVSYQQTVSSPVDDGNAAGGGFVVVQSGDTLSGIAAQLGTSFEQLAACNGVADPDIIYAGQILYY